MNSEDHNFTWFHIRSLIYSSFHISFHRYWDPSLFLKDNIKPEEVLFAKKKRISRIIIYVLIHCVQTKVKHFPTWIPWRQTIQGCCIVCFSCGNQATLFSTRESSFIDTWANLEKFEKNILHASGKYVSFFISWEPAILNNCDVTPSNVKVILSLYWTTFCLGMGKLEGKGGGVLKLVLFAWINARPFAQSWLILIAGYLLAFYWTFLHWQKELWWQLECTAKIW